MVRLVRRFSSTRVIAATLFLFVPFLALISPLSAQNLVANGTFSQGRQDWTVGGLGWVTFAPGYNATFNAADEPCGSTLSQTIITTAGKYYVGNFDYEHLNGSPAKPGRITLTISDATGGTVLLNQSEASQCGTYSTYTFYFTAAGPNTVLTFSDHGSTTFGVDDYLANVCCYPSTAPISFLPFVMPSVAALRSSPHKVFAHYVPYLPLSIDNLDPTQDTWQQVFLDPAGGNGRYLMFGGMVRDRPWPIAPRNQSINFIDYDMQMEVRNAIAAGFDGFTVDIETGPGNPGADYLNAVALLTAANEVDPGFLIVLVPDVNGGAYNPAKDPTGAQTAEMLTQLGAYRSSYHLPNGELVVAPFSPEGTGSPALTPSQWQIWFMSINALLARQSQPVHVAWVPIFQGGDSEDYFGWASWCYGLADWGVNNPAIYNTEAWQNRAHDEHANSAISIYMAPGDSQVSLPSGQMFAEVQNTLNARESWNNACTVNPSFGNWQAADWVQAVTWNDFGEGTACSPSPATNCLFCDLDSYAIATLKLGSPPSITQDVLYFCHRNQSVLNTSYNMNEQSGGSFVQQAGTGPLTNYIELLAFLKSPGTLQIEMNQQTSQWSAGAGITDFKIPLTPTMDGQPTFKLLRGGNLVSSVTSPLINKYEDAPAPPGGTANSPYSITTTPLVQDFLYTGGSDTRMQPTVVNDTDPTISYSNSTGLTGGSWTFYSPRGGGYNDDIHASAVQGDSLEFSFVGTGIDIIGEKAPNDGPIDVFVDPGTPNGWSYNQISCYNSTQIFKQTLFSISGLPYWVHTVKIVNAGGGSAPWATFDAAIVHKQ